jgi:hypothetical protein
LLLLLLSRLPPSLLAGRSESRATMFVSQKAGVIEEVFWAMKKWQVTIAFAALPIITINVILMGMLRRPRSLTLIGALIGISVTCASTLLQVYRLRADPTAAFSIGLIYAMAAGSMLMAVAVYP